MMRLPTTDMNMFLSGRDIKEAVSDDAYVVEIAVPGIVEPENFTAVLHECKEEDPGICCELVCNCPWKCVMLTGKAFSAEVNQQVSIYKISDFVRHLRVPFNAVDPIPKITIVLARDYCDNVTEGIIKVEWKLAVSSIPIEIRDCIEAATMTRTTTTTTKTTTETSSINEMSSTSEASSYSRNG